MRHIPALDGLRGIAILAVVSSHTIPTQGFSGGWLGVDVFFVLSGYLITSILLTEWNRYGSVSFRSFYLRRALRLYPALVLMVLLAIPFAGIFGYQYRADGYLISALVCLTYLSDLALYFVGHAYGQLGHTWSLSVEEHFYLLWPITLIAMLRRRWDARWAAGFGIVLSATLLATTAHDPVGTVPVAYYSPHTQACAPLLGCLVALYQNNRPHPIPQRAATVLAYAGSFLLVGCFAMAHVLPRSSWLAPEVLLGSAATALLILGLSSGTPDLWPGRVLSAGPLRFIGRISYGWYLFHLPAIVVVEHYLPDDHKLAKLVAVPLSLGLAVLSFYLIEQRFLRLKERFGHPQVPRQRSHRTIHLPDTTAPSQTPERLIARAADD